MSGINYNFASRDEIDNDVKTEIDETKIRHSHKDPNWLNEQKRLEDEDPKLVAKGNRGLGVESAMGRDERKFRLKSLYDSGQIKDAKQASLMLHVSESTIRTYAKEMNMKID